MAARELSVLAQGGPEWAAHPPFQVLYRVPPTPRVLKGHGTPPEWAVFRRVVEWPVDPLEVIGSSFEAGPNLLRLAPGLAQRRQGTASKGFRV